MKITSPDMLAQAVTEARKASGLTQAAVAETVGIKQATVSGFENRPENTRIGTLFKLLAALDLEIRLEQRGRPAQSSHWDQEW
ncbi:MAG TPA: transcriptional regulator [Marinobacter sp.]|jgi:HTH-type transcriptional regulator/antitoxin HipB|uniref:helix-turn-helix domain-containing protein n=1 Tax=Marinobacter sp. TaxID=50741 RepID=UPI000EE6E380|nr:helix-turn-helix domain-containing protein [Marinobacter sp.]MBC7191939.1 helix-turn-helix domain-containing protein [Marinobacter sp.]HCW89455.1 transcriptional regulator [Marinobacter sp.]